MVLPALPALAGIFARLLGGTALRAAAGRIAGGAATRALVSPLARIGSVGGNLAANPALYPLRQAQNLAGAGQAAMTNAFIRPAAAVSQRAGSVVNRITNYFSGGPRAVQQAPVGSVVNASPMAGLSGNQFQTLAGGMAPGGGAGSGGGSGGRGGAPGGGGFGGGESERQKSISDMLLKAGAVASVFGNLVIAGKALSSVQLNAQKHLAGFNGKIAGAFNQMQIKEIQRNIRSGNATADTTADLATAVSGLEDSLQPLSDMATNLTNTVLTPLVKVLTDSANATTALLRWLGVMNPAKKGADRSPWEREIIDMAKESRRINRIPKFK